MSRLIKVEFVCDRCGKRIAHTKQANTPFQYVGIWPKGFAKLHGKHICSECKQFFMEQTLPNFFNNGGTGDEAH